MWAALEGHEACVKVLLDAGADTERAEKDGCTALIAAAFCGHAACVNALLDAGADKERAKKDGCTALMAAAFHGHEECVKALLDAGADKNCAQKDGRTALMFAANKGHEACVKALLDAGADKNCAQKDGCTALMFAAVHGHEACVKALLDAGADPCIVDSEGNNARDHALQLPESSLARQRIATLLLDRAAPQLEPTQLEQVMEMRECVICMNAPGTAALLHDTGGMVVSHGGFCVADAEMFFLGQQLCPVCREPITGVVHRQY
jgi:hypothetical protein